MYILCNLNKGDFTMILKLIILIYSILNILVSILSIKKNLPLLNISIFIVGSLLMIYSVWGDFSLNKMISLLIGLLLIQLGAVLNGNFLKGKFSLSHQIIRFTISLVIIFIYWRIM